MVTLKNRIRERWHFLVAAAIVKLSGVDRTPVGYHNAGQGYTDNELAELYRPIAEAAFLPEENADFFRLAEMNAAWFVMEREYGFNGARQRWTLKDCGKVVETFISGPGEILTFPEVRASALRHMKEQDVE